MAAALLGLEAGALGGQYADWISKNEVDQFNVGGAACVVGRGHLSLQHHGAGRGLPSLSSSRV